MHRNSLLLGIISGLFVPLIGFLFIYLIMYMPENISISDFIYLIKSNHYIIPKFISLALLTCIPLITYFKNRRLYVTLKGVFASILFYALIAVLYKLNIL